jgi:hypothetical protein
VLYTHAGQDATATFTAFHSGTAYATMERFLIGECNEKLTADSAFEVEYRAMVPQLQAAGFFRAK